MPPLTLPTRGGRIRFDRFREVRFVEFVAQLYHDPAAGENRGRIVWPAALATAAFELPVGEP